MTTFLRSFGRSRRGATAVEYALIALFIALVLVAGATALGANVNVSFKKVENGFPDS